MMDLTRCRNIFAVGAGLGLSLLAINFVFAIAFGPFPRWLVTEHIPMGWEFMEQNDARVAGLLVETRSVQSESDRVFNVYIGKSSARRDIDPEILAANDGSNGRYLCLWGQGEGMHDLDLLARPILATSLKPHVTLLCIHPAFLAGRASEKLENPLDPFPPPGAGRWQRLSGLICRYNAIHGKTVKIYMNHAIRTALYGARISLFAHLRLNEDAFCEPDRDPWRPRYPDEDQLKCPEDQLRMRVQICTRLGWFGGDQYAKYRRSLSATLVGVIKRFQNRETEVIVVLMPETTEIREHVPPEARRYLVEVLNKGFAGTPPALLDFRDAMPDSMFVDHIHLNSSGRGEFSRLLGRAISDHMAKRPQSDGSTSQPGDHCHVSGSPPRPPPSLQFFATADAATFGAPVAAMPGG
jgi:hypothetical protein